MSDAAERKRVILCADDFDLSENPSPSIVVLAGLRVSHRLCHAALVRRFVSSSRGIE
jgi:hypothetical protein